MLYYSFIYPYLTYGITVWGSAKLILMKSLSTLQRKTLRSIAKTDSLKETFSNLKILNIGQIYKYNVCLFKFKLSKGWLPKYLSTLFQQNLALHSYETRQSYLYHVPMTKANILQRSIRFKGVQLWNNLQCKINPDISLPCFKKKIKCFLISDHFMST